MITKEQLIAFEQDIAAEFEKGNIRAPVHLSGGNEDQLIEIFQGNKYADGIRPQDWVFSTWRSHYHALLKGIPADWLKAEIMAGRSMFIENREHKFLCSSIVGGVLPIALGVALGIKRKGLDEYVYCFVGDMAIRTGICHEVVQYAYNWKLPLRVIEEDNGLSTNTPTGKVWKIQTTVAGWKAYKYTRVWPHVGVGKWVTFG